ncbi:energy-coupling factor transporter ATP-binding protein EcfA2 [Luteibacter sp. 621]|uniref:P-loop NTPase fold protein n=1 Tax=Luteibacter sp. 621 TaxID=3373916 RepID=UPI003D1CF100
MTPRDDDAAPMPRFIRDDPAARDAFGAHSRISEALAATILSADPPRTVGLVGPWGSGKSTVVSLLEADLKRASPTENLPRVFVYDAWLRQGEPPRRSFLEELVAFAAGNGLCDTAILGDALDRLSGKVVVTRTTERPLYSVDAWAILVSAALGGLLGAQAQALKSIPQVAALVDAIRSTAPLLPRFVPFLIPTLTLAVVLLRRAWHWLSNHKAPSAPDAGEDVLALLLNRQAQSKETRVVGTPTATALEFRAVYWQLLGAIEENTGRLVIVIDNLDRLPPQEARELWSMLRTFLVGKPSGSYPEVRLPVVVVPVALEAVDVIYPEQEGGVAADGFMQKTFDATFHLPRPVFTRWQDYFCRQLEASFNRALDEEEEHLLTRLVDEHFAKLRVAVTPRHLNSLVNLVASYVMQTHADRIALSSVLYYCLNKTDIDKDIILAVSGRPSVQAALKKTWTEDIATLHFGVKRTDATKALLEAPLLDAIKAGRRKSFNRLIAISGGVQVLQRILTSMARTNLPVADAMNIMRLLSNASTLGESEKRYAWSQVLRGMSVESGWQVGKRELMIARHFIETAPLPLRAETVTTIEARLAGATLEPVHDIAEEVAAFWAWVDDQPIGSPRTLSTIRIPGDARTFVDVAVSLLQTHRPLEGMRPVASAVDVVRLLEQDLVSDVDTDEAIDRALAVVPLGLPADWKSYARTAHDALSLDAAKSSGSTAWKPAAGVGVAMLGLALLRHHDQDADLALDDLASEGVFAQILSSSLRAHDLYLAGLTTGLLLVLGERPSLPPATFFFDGDDDESRGPFIAGLRDVVEHASTASSVDDLYPWPVPDGELDLAALLRELGMTEIHGATGSLPTAPPTP